MGQVIGDGELERAAALAAPLGEASVQCPVDSVVRSALTALGRLGVERAQVVQMDDAGRPVREWHEGTGDGRAMALAGARAAGEGERVLTGGACAVPILSAGRPWGAICAGADDPGVCEAAVAVLPDLASMIGAHAGSVDIQAEQARQLRLILDSIEEGVYVVDMLGRATFINSAAADMLGWTPGAFVGHGTHDRVHHSHPDGTPYAAADCSMMAALREGTVHHADDEVFWRADGTSFPVAYTTTPLRDHSRVTGAIVTFRDVTDQRRAHRQARTDPLTGLPNRRAFREALTTELSRARAERRPLALALVDLDRFKSVNDTHGHAVGDDVLVRIARELRAAARESDAIARLGGEEFAWLLPGLTAGEAVAVADRARVRVSSLAHPVAGRLTLSAGLAGTGPGDGERDGAALIRAADEALYRAKDAGRDTVSL